MDAVDGVFNYDACVQRAKTMIADAGSSPLCPHFQRDHRLHPVIVKIDHV